MGRPASPAADACPTCGREYRRPHCRRCFACNPNGMVSSRVTKAKREAVRTVVEMLTLIGRPHLGVEVTTALNAAVADGRLKVPKVVTFGERS